MSEVQPAINQCVACQTDDVRTEGIPRFEEKDGKEIICVDMHCEDCGTDWTVEYHPVCWFGYDWHGEYIPTPNMLTPEGKP